MDIGRQVSASHTGDSGATHAAAHTAATTAAAHTAAHTTTTAADFNSGNGEHAALATLTATATATATALTAALTTLGHSGSHAGDTLQAFHEGIGIDAPPAGMQLSRLGKTLTEHDAPLFHRVFQRLLGDLRDDFKNVCQAQISQSRIDANRNIVQVDRFSGLLSLLRGSSEGIHATHSWSRQRLIHLRVHHESDALFLRIAEAGLLVEVLDDLTQRKPIKLDLVDADGVELVINRLTAGSSVDAIGATERIGNRELRLGLFPILLHFEQLILVGQELLAMSAGVLGLANDVQVLVGRTVVGIELDGLLQLGFGAIEVSHFKGELAVLNGDRSGQFVGLVLADVAQRFVGGDASNQIGETLIVLALEVLGLDVVRVDLEDALHLEVGFLVLARLGSIVSQSQTSGGEALDGDVALLLNARTQFLGQIPSVFVGLGGRREIALLSGSCGSLQRLAQDDGFFFAPYGDLTGFLRHGAGGDGIERGNECDETQDLRDFRHGVLHGLD